MLIDNIITLILVTGLFFVNWQYFDDPILALLIVSVMILLGILFRVREIQEELTNKKADNDEQ